MATRKRRRSGGRKSRHKWLRIAGKVGLGYGIFCVANMAIDWVAGNLNTSGTGLLSTVQQVNGIFLPFNVLNYLGASSSGTSGLGRLAGPGARVINAQARRTSASLH